MYKRYCELRDSKGYKDADIYRNTGIAKSTLSDWKNGKSTPKQDKLMLIAECLDVSLDYLMTGKDSEFTIEMAETDLALSNMEKRLKTYALKLAELPKDKQEQIMSLIDMLEDK